MVSIVFLKDDLEIEIHDFFFHLLKFKKKKKSPILTSLKKDFENDND